jgi:hypothetical protein
MVDYYDDDNRDDELVVRFDNCRFHSNRYFGKGAQTSLLMASSNQNRIVINQTLFDNNDMTYNNTRAGTDNVVRTRSLSLRPCCCFCNTMSLFFASLLIRDNNCLHCASYTSLIFLYLSFHLFAVHPPTYYAPA